MLSILTQNSVMIFLTQQTKPDGNCLFSAILDQITHPDGYTAEMLRRQTSFYMARYAHVFFPLVQYDLENDESYESYLVNIFDGNLWADDIMIAAIGRMFNLSITIISPRFDEAMHLFHDVKDPDILLIGNGGPVMSERYNTHFSATKSKVLNAKKPGSTITADKLKFYIKSDFEYGRKVGRERLIETEKQHALQRLKAINKGIHDMEDELNQMKKSLDNMKRKKKDIEKELVDLGVDSKKVREVSGEIEQEQKDREMEEQQREEWKRAEREKVNREEQEKREREEWERVEQEKREREEQEKEKREREKRKEEEMEDVQVLEGEEVISTTEQETESDLVTIEFTEDFTPTFTIPAPPSQQTHHTSRTPTAAAGVPSQIPQSGQATSFIHPFQQQQQVSQYVSQPQSLAAVGGRKGLFGDLFYIGNDNRYYCLRCKRNYRFRQDINKHVKTCGKDEGAKFACEVCGQVLSSKNSLKEHLDRHTDSPEVVCQYCGKKFFNKSKRSNHYAACIAKKQLEDAKAAEKEATAKKKEEEEGNGDV